MGIQYQLLDSSSIPKRTLNQFILIGAHKGTHKNRLTLIRLKEKKIRQNARQEVEEERGMEGGGTKVRISKLFVKKKLFRGKTKQQK